MSLVRYFIDYSKLPVGEFDALCQRIENLSFNGLHINPHTKNGEFFLDESVDVSILHIPDSCCLSHYE